MDIKRNKILFVKPPDRFLEDEFVYQQLGPHYLQSYLSEHNIGSDMLILYERYEVRKKREKGIIKELELEHLNMLHISDDGMSKDSVFDQSIFEGYDIVGLSVMSPQASDAYLLSRLINDLFPQITTVIGGSHPRYYQAHVEALPKSIAFDFIVPQDGWIPMYKIATGQIKKNKKSIVLIDNSLKLSEAPAPSRPLALMKRYNFSIAGVPAYHTITALGCPFTCNFCESGREKVRKFSEKMIDQDIRIMAEVHNKLGHKKKAVMFFDDVGLMNPQQAGRLSILVQKNNYTTWRAFTHAYLVVKYKKQLLAPFAETGGRRIGLGLETGSQRTLDLINKRNGKKQFVQEHIEAVSIANSLGIAVDAFTMIYPWEDEQDLDDTTEMIKFIVRNPVNGIDEKGRPMKNHVDSTIMTPFQGTRFFDMIQQGEIPDVAILPEIHSENLFYKGKHAGSGWPYLKTRLSREQYEKAQAFRNSLRPKYR